MENSRLKFVPKYGIGIVASLLSASAIFGLASDIFALRINAVFARILHFYTVNIHDKIQSAIGYIAHVFSIQITIDPNMILLFAIFTSALLRSGMISGFVKFLWDFIRGNHEPYLRNSDSYINLFKLSVCSLCIVAVFVLVTLTIRLIYYQNHVGIFNTYDGSNNYNFVLYLTILGSFAFELCIYLIIVANLVISFSTKPSLIYSGGWLDYFWFITMTIIVSVVAIALSAYGA